MRFEWDEGKNNRNLAKHKIGFETAKRWQALGLIGGVVVVLVVHTYREEDGEDVIRMISARKAAGPERSL